MRKSHNINGLYPRHTHGSAGHSGRDISLDWIGGLFILVMILSHAVSMVVGDGELVEALAAVFRVCVSCFWYFMCWFFFKAGMFHRIKPQRAVAKDSVRRLLVPYAVFSAIGYVAWMVYYPMVRPEVDALYMARHTVKFFIINGTFPGTMTLWFLVALFFCRCVFNWLRLRAVGPWWILSLSVVVAVAVRSILWEWMNIIIPDLAPGLFFYACGYYLRDTQYRRGVAIGALSFFVILSLLGVHGGVFRLSTTSFDWTRYLVQFPFGLAGCIAVDNVVRRIPPRLLRLSDLSPIGRNSMTYYCLHIVILEVVRAIWQINGGRLSGNLQVVVMVAGCAVILPVADWLFRRYAPWAVGITRRHRDAPELIDRRD